MPASSSDVRTRWRKRKKEPQMSRKLKAPQQPAQDDDGLEEEDEEDEELAEDENAAANNQNPSGLAPERTVQVRESEAVSEGGERISHFPAAVKRVVYRPHSSVISAVAAERAGNMGESRGPGQNWMFLENISHGQLQTLSMVPPDCGPLAEESGSGSGSGSYVISLPRIMKGKGVIKKFGSAERVHVVPCHADWFSPNTVHRLERQVVPHFFSGKSADHTPEKYMECRNSIVAKYMENPQKHMSLTDCRGFISSVSIDDITRILRFLDHWGIINYCAATPSCENQKNETYLCEDSNGDLCVPGAALKTIDSLIHFDKPKCRLKAADVYPELGCQHEEDSDFDSEIREHLSENRCNCCSRPTPTVYFQSQKEVDVLLCLDCFHDGRFVAGHSSTDFVKVNSMDGYPGLDGESWTDQETLLLLEGMQLYNENWNEIAEHVGTKSKAQCILHFVRLSVDPTSLDNIEVPSSNNLSTSRNGGESGRLNFSTNGTIAACGVPDSESKFPFANCGNSVMALVAFLASAVGPRVAAACAHASLATLSIDDTSTSSRSGVQMDGSRMTMEGMLGKEGGPRGDYSNSSQQKDATALSAEKVRAAAKVGLAVAATKAKLFADHEEREIQRLSANIINHQLKRLELKLKQFAEVETLLMRECEQMERTRQRMAAERALMVSTQLGSPGLSPRPMGPPPNVNPAMVNSNVGTSRQQLVPNMPQPFVSGFGNNQPIHSHTTLIPQQQQQQQSMYGVGPRLPLSALHPSSSAAAGAAAASPNMKNIRGSGFTVGARAPTDPT